MESSIQDEECEDLADAKVAVLLDIGQATFHTRPHLQQTTLQ